MITLGSPATSAAQQSFDKRDSLDTVSTERKGSVSYTPADGQKSRASTGSSSVKSETPSVVHFSPGTARATEGMQGAVDEGAANKNGAQDITGLDTATPADGEPGKTKNANGHSRKPSFFSKLPFLRSNSQADGKPPAPKKQDAAEAPQADAVKLTAIAEELTAQEEARGTKTLMPAVDQGSDSATEDTTLLTPAEAAVLAKEEEIEEAPLDIENRPPLVEEKDQKKSKSGGFFGCIKPRTAD